MTWKGSLILFLPPQWEHTEIVCVCLYRIKWKLLLSQRLSPANRLVLPFRNSIKNGHSCYEYWAKKSNEPSGGAFLLISHCRHFGTCKEIYYFQDLMNIPRSYQAFVPLHWYLLGWFLGRMIRLFVSCEFEHYARSRGLFDSFQKFFRSLFRQLMYVCHLEHCWVLCHRYFIVHRTEYLGKSKVSAMQIF